MKSQTRLSVRSINQSNRSISVRLSFLFCSRAFISRSYENRSNGTEITHFTEFQRPRALLKNKPNTQRPESYIFRNSLLRSSFWQSLEKSDFSILYTLCRSLQKTALKEQIYFITCKFSQKTDPKGEKQQYSLDSVNEGRLLLFTFSLGSEYCSFKG